MVEKKNILLALTLGALVAGTIGVGLYFQHYFVVSVFAVWLFVEFAIWRTGLTPRWASYKNVATREFLRLYRENTPASDRLLLEKVSLSLAQGNFVGQEKWFARLRSLVRLRALIFSPEAHGNHRLARLFRVGAEAPENLKTVFPLEISAITETATQVAELYWKLYDCALGEFPDLAPLAKELYGEIFKERFEIQRAQKRIVPLVDAIQRDGGVPFLALNFLSMKKTGWARQLTQWLLTDGIQTEDDEELFSSLYWMSEILWFTEGSETVIKDFETSIRYLYHVCFTDLERAAFLEVDSQFLSNFETVNELAREGFLYKEMLIEKVLFLWKSYEGVFDPVFQSVMQSLTQKRSKIYDSREYWQRYWERRSENFAREYLYLIEGNIAYATGHYEDAVIFYKKAIELDPELRPACLNLLFAYAKINDVTSHTQWVEKLLEKRNLFPSALYMIGDSYMLLGNIEQADHYYKKLEQIAGWEKKVDYYRSTFCYENGDALTAVKYAKNAVEKNPTDISMRYHLSVCYSAMGDKEKALEMVDKLGTGPAWLKYYRFTLERDAGKHSEASQTLLDLPAEYFEDPEELDAAMDFAKLRRDLVLLRHLRKKAK